MIPRRLRPHLLLVPLLVSIPPTVAAQDIIGAPTRVAAGDQRTETADLFSRVSLLMAEVELVRLETGGAEDTRAGISISGAQSHEVFFQALTMFRKADQLCFEHTRQRARVPEVPRGEIRPEQTIKVVDLALERVQLVKSKLGVTEESATVARATDKTYTDVFRSIVQVNRQLNLLLQRRFQPGDVFQQVTLSVSYCSALLARFPQATRLPESPEFERYKRPADVYRRLVGCHRLLRRIAERSGIDLVTLEVSEEELARVTPSDVYDVASLLVSESAYLHARLAADAPRRTYNPGNKLPSHVYQRVGMLELQLRELDKLVAASPDWLRSSEGKR